MVMGDTTQQIDLAVIGGGPGGYTAALRAAQLGIKTILIDEESKLGGTCLREGCIPSKALLHAAEVIGLAEHATAYGVSFDKPRLDLDKLRFWKEEIITKLAQGISGLCKSGKVEVITGQAKFLDERTISVNRQEEGPLQIKFKNAIIATGSTIIKLPKLFKRAQDQNSKRILDSRSALKLPEVPGNLLIVGGGYIGLELGTVYAALGSAVTVVEMTGGLLPGVDRDLVKPLANHLNDIFKNIFLNTSVLSLEDTGDGIACELATEQPSAITKFDYALIAIGRKPNSENLGLENTAVELDSSGFIKVDEFCHTGDKRIMAIGDVSGQPMLAHRAMRQGHVAAEVIAGLPSAFDNMAIPAVVYTQPEIAWCGLTETEAKAKDYKVEVAKFPWTASGRALTLAEPIGLTKIIYDPENMLVKGVGIVGARAGDLIAEAVLAIESGLVLEDLARAIHPHPSLSETVGEAAMTGLNRQARRSSNKD